jgi:hypothetical protein
LALEKTGLVGCDHVEDGGAIEVAVTAIALEELDTEMESCAGSTGPCSMYGRLHRPVGVEASQGDIADVPLDWDTGILVSLHYKVQENGTNLKASTLCCDTRAPWRKHISASGSGGC